MRITLYIEYPIYEPAEGGYYYEGESVGGTPKKVKAGKGRRKILTLYREIQREAEIHKGHAWISEDGRQCGMIGKYIGTGFRYVLEGNRRVGRRAHGWHPYC